jgi:ATP-dependent helicase/nuclease subunit A
MPNNNSTTVPASLLAELDDNQRKAASAEFNAVVTAGAGSGKTKVLASRYAWLVMEKGLKVDEILTLTFTNKAVNEMYTRIFGLLAEHQNNSRAREAVREFHKAHIMTLDAFCAGIARTASTRFGISPDFVSDNGGVKELAVNAALPFVLAHRDNTALQALIADRKIRTVAEELFAETVIAYSPVSSPLDFNAFMLKQDGEILKQWKANTQEVSSLVDVILQEYRGLNKTEGVFYGRLKEQLDAPVPETPDIVGLLKNTNSVVALASAPVDRRQFALYFDWLRNVSFTNQQYAAKECAVIKENLTALRDIYPAISSIANTALQRDIVAGIFPLVEEFQRQFNRQKRESGLLTFNDIARLAVDALTQFPDIRKVYKDSFKSIMVDEFQDNNSLQRDLIFLLAENENRMEAGLPEPEDLSNGKMFFVGDEKQSIYRFRGADVSVFRSLAKTLSSGSAGLSLVNNYRSQPGLINAFNRIFGGLGAENAAEQDHCDQDRGDLHRYGAVFLPEGEELPEFEAAYQRVYAAQEDSKSDQAPQVHFCFLDESALDKNNPQTLSKQELEAAYIAAQIRDMVDSGYEIPVRGKDGVTYRTCEYRDFAVLQRTYTHQSALEKQCKNFGVPFTTDRPVGLFNDAPVNDLYMYLRLLLDPGDRIAYSAVIRSPFTRLSDETLTVCMLNSENSGDSTTVPFDETLESQLPVEDRELFAQARERYGELAQAARNLPVTALITRLWYDEGYRYETLWSASSQIYSELFDLFFELARKIDEQGKTLLDFFEYLESLINKEEKLDGIDLPPEEEGGIRITSIHKSKGLEFPVVFVFNCSGKGLPPRNSQTVYFSEKWGVTVNLPKAEELPEDCGNYFFNLQREEEAAKEAAELRRLLYVAMTRAESRLFLTATVKGEDGETPDADEYLKPLLAALKEKRQEKYAFFLDLLLPALVTADDEHLPFSFETIPAYTRQELSALAAKARQSTAKGGGSANRADGTSSTAQIRAAKDAAPLYENAGTVPTPTLFPASIPASSLHITEESDTADGDRNAVADADIDRVLEKAGLEAADFGTMVHAFLEGRLNSRPPFIPPGIIARLADKDLKALEEKADLMAEGFINSEMGKLCANAVWLETEFPILTIPDCGEGRTAITGQIDLLFEVSGQSGNTVDEQEGVIYVVDFKTDRVEEPERHFAQLAVYQRAISDIFDKPVRPWLFYLRSGRAADLSGKTGTVNIEGLVRERLTANGQHLNKGVSGESTAA